MERKWKLGEDLFLQDNVLDPIAFDELVMTVKCNSKVINGAAVRKALMDIIELRMEDCLYLLENNVDEMVAEAVCQRGYFELLRNL